MKLELIPVWGPLVGLADHGRLITHELAVLSCVKWWQEAAESEEPHKTQTSVDPKIPKLTATTWSTPNHLNPRNTVKAMDVRTWPFKASPLCTKLLVWSKVFWRSGRLKSARLLEKVWENLWCIIAREGQPLAKDPANSPKFCKNSYIVLSQSPTVLYNILFQAVYEYHPKNLQIKTGSRPTTPHFIKILPGRHTYIFHNAVFWKIRN